MRTHSRFLSRSGLDSLRFVLAIVLFLVLAVPVSGAFAATGSATVAVTNTATGNSGGPGSVKTVPGMPPVVDPGNLYSEIGAGHLRAVVRRDLNRVYVPNIRSDDVYEIDPATMKVVARFPVGKSPQHIVPSYDLRTLWVANNAEGTNDGSVTPIDPRTGKPGKSFAVDDPYNIYFTPDGASAIIVAEAHRRLDFRDPHTLALQYSISAPQCDGINHADFAIDGRYAIFTCEFNGSVVKIDLVHRKVESYLILKMPKTRFREIAGAHTLDRKNIELFTGRHGMPQDIRISPDGKRFYVADMDADGVHILDGDHLREIDFLRTGLGTHGLYPSRNGRFLYATNRGSHRIHGPRHGAGGVTVIDFATGKIVAQWPIPGGGSPDMGNVSADGTALWLSGRFDDVVYRFDTTTGAVRQIAVGMEPHGLTVWPQPGRYCLGHTGNLR